MRMIDADALKLSHCKECTLYPDECMGDDCDWNSIAHIKMMPTIDAEPVRHAKWIGGEIGTCSVCGHRGCASDIWNDCKGWFCPNCGAKMDEES